MEDISLPTGCQRSLGHGEDAVYQGRPKEPMLLYIATTSRVVSTVIVVERKEEGKALPVQRPVYYLSEVLSTSKQNYPHY